MFYSEISVLVLDPLDLPKRNRVFSQSGGWGANFRHNHGSDRIMGAEKSGLAKDVVGARTDHHHRATGCLALIFPASLEIPHKS